MKAEPHLSKERKVKGVGELLHSDIIGPVNSVSSTVDVEMKENSEQNVAETVESDVQSSSTTGRDHSDSHLTAETSEIIRTNTREDMLTYIPNYTTNQDDGHSRENSEEQKRISKPPDRLTYALAYITGHDDFENVLEIYKAV